MEDEGRKGRRSWRRQLDDVITIKVTSIHGIVKPLTSSVFIAVNNEFVLSGTV